MHSFIACLAVSIGKPLMEPLLSMAKMISLGTICGDRTRFGGWSTTLKNLPRESLCASTLSAISSLAVW